MTRKLPIGRLALLAALLPGPAAAVEFDWTFKGAAVGQFDGGRDLGLAGNPSTQQGYLDLTPWVHLQFSDAWSGLVRARFFAPTDAVLVAGNDNNNVGPTSKAYVGLKEAWLDYRGLTSYPGESFRVGRQRVREDDAQWWDQDIDAARWIFDTSLLQIEAGAARQFNSYRSDGAPLPAAQQDRTYSFASFASDVLPGLRVGSRIVHADDDGAASGIGRVPGAGEKRERGHLTWIGAWIDNHAFDYDEAPPLSYWTAANGLLGSRHRPTTDATTGRINGERAESVSAWAAEGGARWRLPTPVPVQLGVAYVHSSGGHAGDRSEEFEQTGLQSNYSRFTGTRTLINRYNDAYRAELGNLRVATAFASSTYEAWDASAIFSHFERVHGSGPVTVDGITSAPTTNNVTLGNGYDLVLTRYFGNRKPVDRLEPGEDAETTLRLRGSLFDPGSAYGPSAQKDYRITLELTLWY